MLTPGKVVTQVFRFARFSSLSKKNKYCSVFATRAFQQSCVTSVRKIAALPKIVGKDVKMSKEYTKGGLSPNDPSSYSRPEYVIIKHASLNLNVDFTTHTLSGTAQLNLEALQDIDEVILDVKNLTIESIVLADGTNLNYTVDRTVDNFGSKLTINLPHVVATTEKAPEETSEKIEDELPKIPSDPSSSYLFKFSPDKLTGKFALPTEEDAESCKNCRCDSDHARKEDVKSQTKGRRTTKEIKCLLLKKDFKNKPVSFDYRFVIKIQYSTAPDASALQWLEPSQTSGKKHPYLFSQCQPIHARSIFPCQDTPAVKFTYDAKVTAPEEFTVLMSALRKGVEGNVTSFQQPTPIPSYLLAIAVGVLEQKTLGPRTIVWTERNEIERAAWEFYDAEKFIQAAEKLCGPYVWSQYDLLVLPPSFPYGGMENPCLTFVTPTLLAGDRSQADVLVHEIMHSWTGNLVTNRNFEHFWLNEGFTVFLERKVAASLIADPVEAKKSRDFHSLLGLQELTEAVYSELSPTSPLTQLVVDLRSVHPDDAFSTVPYEKGSLFLRYLEDLVGGPEIFDGFLRSYLNRFARQSIVTDQFKEHLLSYFEDTPNHEKLLEVDWKTWLYTPGMPPTIPQYDTSMTKAITTLITQIEDEKHEISASDIAGFTPHQIIHFLQELIERRPLSIDRLELLGEAYNVSTSKNSEIEYRWLRLCVRSRNENKLPDVFTFVNTQGRMKYIRPLYRDLYDWKEVRQTAIDNFLANEKNMMHVSAYTVRKDLHLA